MAHKVHPKSYRLRSMNDWESKGFYGSKAPTYLKEDLLIREFLGKKLEKMGIEKIQIERLSGKINVVLMSSRPGLIIGRGGEGVERLKKELASLLLKKSPDKPFKKGLALEIKEIRNPWLSSGLSAQWIAQQLERRMPYKRVLKQVLEKIIANKEVLGVRVEIAGRLDGVEIARREWLQKGKLPRQTLRADIDYARYVARCSYGVIGIKVWIYKGEKFN